MELSKLNETKVKEIAHANPTATATMLALGFRKRSRSETNLTRVRQQLITMKENVVDKDYFDFWRELERAKIGSIVLGRRGKQTRFRWNYSLQDVAKVAVGESSEIKPKRGRGRPRKNPEIDSNGLSSFNQTLSKLPLEKQERIVVKIKVRPDYSFEAVLPKDVTKEELAQIGKAFSESE